MLSSGQTPEAIGERGDTGFFKRLLTFFLPILLLIAALVLTVVFTILRYRSKVARQRKLMRGEPTKALKYILNRSDELIEAEGCPSFREVKSADELKGMVTDDLLTKWKLLDQELTFSKHTFTEQIRDEMCSEYENLAKRTVEGKRFFGRLATRYGKCYI